MEDVLRHYRSLAPRIRELIRPAVEGRIIEGSAVLPELAVEFSGDRYCCFLVAQPGMLTQRIMRNAAVEIEAAKKFAERAELMNEFIDSEAKRLELPTFNTDAASAETILASYEQSKL